MALAFIVVGAALILLAPFLFRPERDGRGRVTGPPDPLVRSVLDGPSAVRGFEWHAEVTSTNVLAAEAAERGEPGVYVVAADVQTAGRGRQGRSWSAPPGTSLMCSWMWRPPAGADRRVVPLAVGVALAQVTAAHCPGVEVTLKWPNDLLLDGRKAAGILIEAPAPDVIVVGTGMNVDWRSVERPAELEGTTSLAEAVGAPIDRWRVFAGLVGVLTRRLEQVVDDAPGLLADYRAYCSTLGRRVRVTMVGRPAVEGQAVDLDAAGALVVATSSGRQTIHAGDVKHLRAA